MKVLFYFFIYKKIGFRKTSTIVNAVCYIYTLFERRSSMDVVEDIMKELNWKERIIVKVFAKTFKKVYNKCRIRIVNSMLS